MLLVVTIKRKNCDVYVNHQFVPVNTRFEEEDVIVYNDGSIARNPTIVHVTVPNCGIPTLDSMYMLSVTTTTSEGLQHQLKYCNSKP